MRDRPNDPRGRSWSDRAIELSYVGRSGIGSCSPVGAGGFVGCQTQLINEARAERRARSTISWGRLIDEARRERLGRIAARRKRSSGRRARARTSDGSRAPAGTKRRGDLFFTHEWPGLRPWPKEFVMKRFVPLALALAAGTGFAIAAQAQPAGAQADNGGRRVSQLIVYGNDPCPPSTADEIVVCARRSEDDRYRIPEPLRGNSQVSDNQSWAANARALEYVGRTGIQSCSTVGPGGFTGCWAEMMRQSREERQTNPAGQPIP